MKALTALLAVITLVGGGLGMYVILTQAKKLKTLGDKVETSDREIARLEDRANTLKKELAARGEALTEREGLLAALKTSATSAESELRRELETVRNKVKELAAQLEAAEKQNADIRGQLDAARKEKADIASRMAGVLREKVARMMRDFSVAQEPLWNEIRLLRVCLDDATQHERNAVVEHLEAGQKPDEKTKALHEVLRRGGFVNLDRARTLLETLTAKTAEAHAHVKSLDAALLQCEKEGADAEISFEHERRDLRQRGEEIEKAIARARTRLSQFKELTPVEVDAGLDYGKDNWMDSRHAVQSGDVVYLAAEGMWRCTGVANQLLCGPHGGVPPAGSEGWGDRQVWKEFPLGALLVRAGGQVHAVPGFACVLAMKAGSIEFRPNDSGGGTGKMVVSIVIRREKKEKE